MLSLPSFGVMRPCFHCTVPGENVHGKEGNVVSITWMRSEPPDTQKKTVSAGSRVAQKTKSFVDRK